MDRLAKEGEEEAPRSAWVSVSGMRPPRYIFLALHRARYTIARAAIGFSSRSIAHEADYRTIVAFRAGRRRDGAAVGAAGPPLMGRALRPNIRLKSIRRSATSSTKTSAAAVTSQGQSGVGR